jgi:hypothetical protein
LRPADVLNRSVAERCDQLLEVGALSWRDRGFSTSHRSFLSPICDDDQSASENTTSRPALERFAKLENGNLAHLQQTSLPRKPRGAVRLGNVQPCRWSGTVVI